MYQINGMVTDPGEISSLFGEETEVEETKEEKTETPEEKKNPGEDTPDGDEEKITDEQPNFTAEELFDEDEDAQEKVGNDEDNKPEGAERESSKKKKEGSSPANSKLYSSIANSLFEDGALSSLSDEDLEQVKDSASLIEAMKKQVNSMLDDQQKRIAEALDAGMVPNQVKQFENAIQYLDSLTEDQISEESAEGENLRRALIYQYQMSKGETEERANKMVVRAFSGGNDVEDAKEYLEALKEYYTEEYNKQIEAGKQEVAKRKKQQEDDVKKFKETLLNDSKILGDIEVDTKTRQLAFDNWMKPTFKTEKGVYQSAIQKYIAENPADFQMKVALLFTMTDGFKKMGNVLKQTVTKEKKKAMQELESVVNSTQRTPSGALNPFGGNDKDSSFNGLQFAPASSWRQ